MIECDRWTRVLRCLGSETFGVAVAYRQIMRGWVALQCPGLPGCFMFMTIFSGIGKQEKRQSGNTLAKIPAR